METLKQKEPTIEQAAEEHSDEQFKALLMTLAEKITEALALVKHESFNGYNLDDPHPSKY